MNKNRYEKSLLVAGFFKRVIGFSNLVSCFCLGKISLTEYKVVGKKQNSPNKNKTLMYNKGVLYHLVIQARGSHD